ncbi:hypothetical protein ACKWTF_004653 [Chironomus riparius]
MNFFLAIHQKFLQAKFKFPSNHEIMPHESASYTINEEKNTNRNQEKFTFKWQEKKIESQIEKFLLQFFSIFLQRFHFTNFLSLKISTVSFVQFKFTGKKASLIQLSNLAHFSTDLWESIKVEKNIYFISV